MSHDCCTSSSALDIVNNIESDKIIFVPDRNLGGYIKDQCPDKEFIIGNGRCCVHDDVTAEEVRSLKEKNPGAEILVHPEARVEVRDMADFLGSTGQILSYAMDSDSNEFIIVTEKGINFALEEKTENKTFHYPQMVCGGMKKTSPSDILACLRNEENEIILDKDVSSKAAKALENMIKLAEKR